MNASLAGLCLAAVGSQLCAQSTQGLVSGQIFDRTTQLGIAGMEVVARNLATAETAATSSGRDGRFVLLSLSPGRYTIRAGEGSLYQAVEIYGLELSVGARLDVQVRLRLAADTYSEGVYSAGFLPDTEAVVHIYAADLQTTKPEPISVPRTDGGPLRTSVSHLVDGDQIRGLPLSGRDAYTMLATLPGITSDNPTARGLGMSSMGQRATSSNFLLDGVENNEPLTTGPLATLPPEAIAEYRVSVSNFSAEYGHTSGFLANAITRGGANAPHGVAYSYLNDTALNANSYSHKSGFNTSTGQHLNSTLPRQHETDWRNGFWAGGAIQKDRLFASTAYERLRTRGSGDDYPFEVPVVSWINRCQPGPIASALLAATPPPIPAGLPAFTSCDALSTPFIAKPSLAQDRHTALVRGDWVPAQHQRTMARWALSRFADPYFISSPYAGLSSPLHIDSASLAVAHVVAGPSWSNEARLGVRWGGQGWQRPEGQSAGLVLRTSFARLPGNPAQSTYDYSYGDGEVSDTARMNLWRTSISIGAGLTRHDDDSGLRFRDTPLFQFDSLLDFIHDKPSRTQLTIDRLAPANQVVQPVYPRSRQAVSGFGLAQIDRRVTPRLGVNVGLRVEHLGAPKQTGALDPVVKALPTLRLVPGDASRRQVYQADSANAALRLGLSYALPASTVFRASWGRFFDRLFDNLTQTTRNSSFELVEFSGAYPSGGLLPGSTVLRKGLPAPVWLSPALASPHADIWFAGFENRPSRDMVVSVLAHGAYGRNLIGSDFVNRRAPNSLAADGLNSPALPRDTVFRGNFISSNYHAMTASASYRGSHAQIFAGYTWGHSIDNQSDPLQGSFEDFGVTRSNLAAAPNVATLTREGDPAADRGSSDFDQRHNFVLTAIAPLPGNGFTGWRRILLSDWHAAGMMAIRSGFPFSVTLDGVAPGSGLRACPGSGGPLETRELKGNRPSLLPGVPPYLAERVPVPGGYQILDPAAFCHPGLGVLGSLGRNALVSPAFWNADASFSKRIRAAKWPEAASLELRLDAFNVFNHANLSTPGGQIGFSSFGQSLLGRQGLQPSFPSAAPLDQLPRQLQVQLKFVF